VISVDLAELPKELRASAGTDLGPVPRVSIFLNLFDVHVNRVVVAGTIEKIVYTPGQFVNASFDKASELNERSVVLMRDDAGRVLAFAQIAGLVARRIVNHLKEGQRVKAGERFGLIRFGSRAEIWMPAGTQVRVKAGQRVLAGQSLLATLPAVG
jgi:phosphatidylserine decarboxylase